MNRTIPAAAVALLLAGGLAAPARAQSWQRDFLEGMKSESSDRRRQAIEGIDADGKGAVQALLTVLTSKSTSEVDWYQLGAAVRKISEVPRTGADPVLRALRASW